MLFLGIDEPDQPCHDEVCERDAFLQVSRVEQLDFVGVVIAAEQLDALLELFDRSSGACFLRRALPGRVRFQIPQLSSPVTQGLFEALVRPDGVIDADMLVQTAQEEDLRDEVGRRRICRPVAIVFVTFLFRGTHFRVFRDVYAFRDSEIVGIDLVNLGKDSSDTSGSKGLESALLKIVGL